MDSDTKELFAEHTAAEPREVVEEVGMGVVEEFATKALLGAQAIAMVIVRFCKM